MKNLKILLVEDSPEYSSLVLQWLAAGENRMEFSLVWTDTLAAAIARLEKGGIDVILMDLGLPDSDGIQSFTALRAKNQDLPIIVLSAGDSQALALQTIQLGAEDYLVKSTCNPEMLVRTLRHAVVRHLSTSVRGRAREVSNAARVIGVLGAAGGVGATTVACVLAAELQHQSSQSTLLIDLDSNPGLVGFVMGVDPQYSLRDLAENNERLDRSLWEGVVTRRPGGLEILTSQPDDAAAELSAESLLAVIAFASPFYRWIVLDLGRLNRNSRRLIASVTDLLLVSAENIASLHQCKQAVGSIHEMGIGRDHFGLVLNRLHDGEELPRKELENLFGVSISAILPPSRADLSASCLKRQLPSVTGRFRLGISAVARKMAGLPEEAQKRSLLSLTSLADRFRRKTDSVETTLVP